MTIYKGETSLETRKQAEELLAEIRRQAYAEGYEQGFKQAKFDAEMDEQFRKVSEVVTQESPQEKRDRIVERAKADVAKLTKYSFKRTFGGDVMGFSYKCYTVIEEIVVNKDKRTVVCLLRGVHGKSVISRGIAKCAPGDCFNVHIGKAIALRRALGLEVPDEYLNAPQPTEVRVGDVIKYECDRDSAIVVKDFNSSIGTRMLDFVKKYKGHKYKIIDDSESIAP